jgi:DNA polymerase-3 subunit gamma/tau
MPYQVMARERRPEVFKDVLSQDHIIKTIQNAIRADRIAQAYLFSGPRGTGKTTTARLLAKALNCEQGPTPDPCGECASCTAIRDGRSLDVREIDGASTGHVEDVRKLREEVAFAASKGKRKVYIIDEVHMLSKEAFNALLKTLEEPPPHVVFVFATTEPNKVLDTITSRCQRYNFRRIPTRDIVAELKRIVEEKSIDADEESLYLIAQRADGALRDALSLMDQAISFSETGIVAESVRDLLGIVPRVLYFDLTTAIQNQDGATALKLIADLLEQGGDVGEFVVGLLEHLRHLLVAHVEGEVVGADLPEAELVLYQEASTHFEEHQLVRMLNTVAELELNIGRVGEPRFWLELTVMKLIQVATTVELETLLARLDGMGSGSGSGSPAPGTLPSSSLQTSPLPTSPEATSAPAKPVSLSPRKPTPRAPSKPAGTSSEEGAGDDSPPPPESEGPDSGDTREEEHTGTATPVTIEGIKARWDELIAAVREEKVSVGTFLGESEPRSLDDNQLLVMFKRTRDFHANQVRRNHESVEQALKAMFGLDLRLVCEVDYDEDPEDVKQERRVEEDERVQTALKIFDGEIVGR